MKKPLGPCTFAIATAIVATIRAAPTGVHSPRSPRAPPSSSPNAATAAQKRAGRSPRLAMNPLAPARPGPPNAPNAFCAPWPRNTSPSTTRSANNPRSPIIAASNYLEFEILYLEQFGNIVPCREVPEMMPSATIPPAPRRDPALRLWVVLARAFDAVERHSRASIARFDLGTTEFGVLEVLYHKARLPVCEVQRRIR